MRPASGSKICFFDPVAGGTQKPSIWSTHSSLSKKQHRLEYSDFFQLIDRPNTTGHCCYGSGMETVPPEPTRTTPETTVDKMRLWSVTWFIYQRIESDGTHTDLGGTTASPKVHFYGRLWWHVDGLPQWEKDWEPGSDHDTSELRPNCRISKILLLVFKSSRLKVCYLPAKHVWRTCVRLNSQMDIFI
jgi:hypothetical protein